MYVASFSHLQENVSLLKEINDLRTELKKNRTHAHDLEATLKIARKQGFDEQSGLASTMSVMANTGLTKVEAPDNSRIIEMQKLEISRLRSKLRDAEIVRKPSPIDKLPPVNSGTISVQ